MGHEYNKEFAIPEMVISYRAASSRFLRDLVLTSTIAIFLIFFHDKQLKFLDLEISVTPFTSILIGLLVFVLFLAMVSHGYRLHLLLRRIDTEVKYAFVSNAPPGIKGATAGLISNVFVASHQTAFVLSENFLSDFVIAGHKRLPTVWRTLTLQWIFVLGFALLEAVVTSVGFQAIREIFPYDCILWVSDMEPYSSPVILMSFAIWLVVLGGLNTVIFRLFFVARSVSLEHSRVIRETFISYARLRHRLDWVAELSGKAKSLPDLSAGAREEVLRILAKAGTKALVEAWIRVREKHQHRMLQDARLLLNLLDLPNHQEDLRGALQEVLDIIAGAKEHNDAPADLHKLQEYIQNIKSFHLDLETRDVWAEMREAEAAMAVGKSPLDQFCEYHAILKEPSRASLWLLARLGGF